MCIQDLHLDYENWLSKIILYKEDLRSLNSSLLNLLEKSIADGGENELENFQKKFKNQGRKISLIIHNVKTKQDILTQFPQEHPIEADDILYDDHISLKNEYYKFESVFAELKNDFDSFISKFI